MMTGLVHATASGKRDARGANGGSSLYANGTAKSQ
jgi:hypothetical protein